MLGKKDNATLFATLGDLLADLAERVNPATATDTFWYVKTAAELNYEAGYFDAAIAQFEKALRLLERNSRTPSECVEIMFDIALCHEANGDKRAAAEWRERAEAFENNLEAIEEDWAARLKGGAS